jgi:hypothetical protein
MRREPVSERRGEVDEERDESLSDVGPGAAGVSDDLRKERLKSVHSEAREDLRETLSGSLSVDSGRIGSKGLEEILDESGEVVLAETLDERSECLGRGSPSLGDGVDKDDVDEREEGDDYVKNEWKGSGRKLKRE